MTDEVHVETEAQDARKGIDGVESTTDERQRELPLLTEGSGGDAREGSRAADSYATIALQQRISSLELENRLLKQEMTSLNSELGAMTGRLREVEGERGKRAEERQELRERLEQLERALRKLHSREEDLQAMLNARDTQIEVGVWLVESRCGPVGLTYLHVQVHVAHVPVL